MNTIHVYSYVEDEPSKKVLVKLVEEGNRICGQNVVFRGGFPVVTRGFGNIKKKCDAFLNMAASKQHILILTDLDANECPATLIREWFFPKNRQPCALPPEVVFRVAVREVEAWLMADKDAFSRYLGVASSNFVDEPEALPHPKQFLLKVLRNKAKRKAILDMLPTGTAHIGPAYNDRLCDFIASHWSIKRACGRSPSLQKALNALGRITNSCAE